ncbi:HypE family hydrogenase expression/formation protein [Nocardia sp. CA-135953]|uniref:HypE family hydrogenase expression/formation protein n=1 Tax=Nocardia sp. CA-135953 TaxID=3239978 RepID=UPI003D985306
MTEKQDFHIPVGIGAGDGLGATADLLTTLIFPALGIEELSEDGTRIAVDFDEQVVTTDMYTVDPLEFSGGDIGRLAVCGAVNDLAASGARARFLTVGLLISASLGRDVLFRVLTSFGQEAEASGCTVLCGDTKVHTGHEPQLVIAVSAVGQPFTPSLLSLKDTRPGDVIGVTGPFGNHSIAVLSARFGLGFDKVVTSDVCALADPIEAVVSVVPLHGARDLTRGGLIGALWDGARATGLHWEIEDDTLDLDLPVSAAAQLLALDPLALTNEGNMLFTCPRESADRALEILRGFSQTARSRLIGYASTADRLGPLVSKRTPEGRQILLDYPEALGIPRLC